MTIDYAHFTPLTALIGGLLIGLSTAILILFNGRIAGISGIIANAFLSRREKNAWRFAFIGGLITSPLFYHLFTAPPASVISTSPLMLTISGLLVGVGTRYASGCTSGHGVCGLARLSPRSLAATLAFMAAGFLTVYLVRHVW